MEYAEAMDLIGGLSKPSKMPWYSWSTPAEKCKTGSKLREVEGSTCASCYACKGCYIFKNVQAALERRFDAIEHPDFVKAFTIVLTRLYENGRRTRIKDGVEQKENRFRWHDSGDIQSVEHLKRINQIALNTPFLDHWIPTREYGIVNQYLKEGNTFAENLLVRMSATMVGQDFEKAPMGLTYSTVGVDSEELAQCPAYDNDGKCGDCDTCWQHDIEGVNYPLH